MGKARIPVEQRSRQLQRYYDNREALLEYQREYQREYRAANADAIKAGQALYRKRHKEQLRTYSREWIRKKRAAIRAANSGDGMANLNKAIIAEKEGNVK